MINRYYIQYRDKGCFWSVYVRARNAEDAVNILESI